MDAPTTVLPGSLRLRNATDHRRHINYLTTALALAVPRYTWTGTHSVTPVCFSRQMTVTHTHTHGGRVCGTVGSARVTLITVNTALSLSTIYSFRLLAWPQRRGGAHLLPARKQMADCERDASVAGVSANQLHWARAVRC